MIQDLCALFFFFLFNQLLSSLRLGSISFHSQVMGYASTYLTDSSDCAVISGDCRRTCFSQSYLGQLETAHAHNNGDFRRDNTGFVVITSHDRYRTEKLGGPKPKSSCVRSDRSPRTVSLAKVDLTYSWQES